MKNYSTTNSKLSIKMLFMLLLPISLAYAEQDQRHQGYSGFSEITLETGNTQGIDNETSLEQWNEIIYKDLNNHKEMGIQFSVKLGTEKLEAEIYQLYLKQPYEDKTITMGRFEQIDARGFYTLDGLSLKPANVDDWWFFIGAPKRIDAYNGVDGGFLIGAEKRFSRLSSENEKQYFRVGLQQQWDGANNGSYLNLGFSQPNKQPQQYGLTRLDFSAGLRLDEASVENFIAKAEFDLDKQSYLYLSYDHYQPPKKVISFHDRFYQSYALKSQDVLRADWHKKLNSQSTLNLQARQVWHKKGSNGQGFTAGLHHQPNIKDWQAELRADLVQLADDQSATLYANFKQPLSSVLTVELEGMVQQKETLLTGRDNSQGIAFRLKQMLKRDLQLEGYGEYINQSDGDNEYQLGIRLRKDFHDLGLRDL